jgi:translation initiation factor 2 subunit 2
MDYEKLLAKAMKDLPENVVQKERFEIPKVKGFIQGNKTVVTNFNTIVSALRRDVQHFLKYLLKEVASHGTLEGTRLNLGRKISSSLLNTKIKKYADEYVICEKCGKPDTSIINKEGKSYLKCGACGHQKEIKL